MIFMYENIFGVVARPRPKRKGEGQARPKSKRRARRDPTPEERTASRLEFCGARGFQNFLIFELEI